MAREKQQTPEPPQGFVASAVRLPSANVKDVGRNENWQRDAWALFDEVGELRYLGTYTGNVLSRAEWRAAKREGNRLKVLDSGPAHDAMMALYGGVQGQAEMTKALGTNLVVGGEGFIVWRAKEDAWHTLRTGNVTQDETNTVHIDFGGKTKVKKDPKDLVIRVWQPHPGNPKQADAPTRSNLTTLRQIVGYDQHIDAQLQSRLAGAGILPLPSEIDFPIPEDAPENATQASVFMSVLHEAMMTAKEDRSNPAALVPIVITVPGEFIDKLPEKPIQFWTELDGKVIEMREAAVRRLATGMDSPPEVLLGVQDSNHWNAWLAEESAIKTHVEPRLGAMAQGLTEQYLRPSLKGTALEAAADDYYVVADTAPIRAKQNRATEAIELWDRGLLADERTLQEAGFHEDDKMPEDQYRRWLLQRISLGAVTPELTAEALRLLGTQIEILNTSDNPQLQPTHTKDNTEVSDPANSAPDQGESEQRADRQRDALVATCEMLAFRALERAGNKLKNHNGVNGKVDAQTFYLDAADSGDPDKLLAGAWDCADRALSEYPDVKVDEMVGVLDYYVRGLLSQRRAYSRNTLRRIMFAEQVMSV